MELLHTNVREVVLGRTTSIREGVLTLDPDALRADLASIPDLAHVELHVAAPATSTRLVCVKDVVEPRLRISGARSGEGRVRALRGVAVATCGQIVGYQEGIVDMSGPGAAYSPFAQLQLVVVEARARRGVEPHAHEAALREAGLRAAACLARATADAPIDEVERFQRDDADPSLPRLVYVCMCLSQGLLHDTWVEGVNARSGLPRRVDPCLPLAGGVVSGNCVSACDKNTTWHHQNNPLVRELFARHGRELHFAGCVLTPEPVRLAEKEAAARACVEEVLALGAQGAVISKEGFGNPDADLMMLIRGLEAAGVRCVALTDEFAGVDGSSPSLADAAPEADALVSVGNANARIQLPPMERTLGPMEQVPALAGATADSVDATGGIQVELQSILGATNQLGGMRLSCRDR